MSEAFVLSFLDDAKHSTDIDMLKQAMRRTMEAIGLSRWAYACKTRIIHTYPDEWVERYISRDYNKLDPVITKGCALSGPFRWSKIAPLNELSKCERSYFGEAMDFGLNDGLGVPVVGSDNSVIFSIAVDDTMASIDSRIANEHVQYIALAYAFHSVYERIMASGQSAESPLSPRESECLLWAARGKTSAEIGDILKISERTVIFHIENSKRKMNVRNRSQAAIQAMAFGYIKP